MQKKILSTVLSVFLVSSASVAFADYYPPLDVDIRDSFNKEYDVEIEDSFNKSYDIDLNVNKTIDSHNTTQGNGVEGHIVIQQFGQGGYASGGGDVLVMDNSINDSAINSFNATDSYNTNRTYNRTYTKNLDLDLDVDIDDSFNAEDSFNTNLFD